MLAWRHFLSNEAVIPSGTWRFMCWDSCAKEIQPFSHLLSVALNPLFSFDCWMKSCEKGTAQSAIKGAPKRKILGALKVRRFHRSRKKIEGSAAPSSRDRKCNQFPTSRYIGKRNSSVPGPSCPLRERTTNYYSNLLRQSFSFFTDNHKSFLCFLLI